MPKISRLLGIAIAKDHGEDEITVEIDSTVVAGRFPPRALRLVMTWCRFHREEHLENRARASARVPLLHIAPLE